MVAASQHAPALVSSDPYGDGWVIRMRPSDPSELDALKSGRIDTKADLDEQDEIKVVELPGQDPGVCPPSTR